MSVSIQRPNTFDVTKNNPNATIYFSDGTFTANENTNSSIRFLYDPADGMLVIRKRANGVWNDDSIRTASGSLHIGRDLILSATAGLIETRNPSGIIGHIRSVIPQIQFDDDGTKQPQTPILKAEETFVVFGTAVSEVTGTTIGVILGVSPGRVIEESIHQVGTTGATSQITVTMYNGTDNTGDIIDQRNLPASDMAAGATLEINYDNDLGFLVGQTVFMEFKSDNNISLKTDISGNPLTTHEGHELSSLELLTENLVYDNNHDHILDNSFNPIYSQQFP